jgi:chemotaxis methyl-accepting protein methylase
MQEAKGALENRPEQLERVLHFISKERGIDLNSYRQTFAFRHLRSRMSDTECCNCQEYLNYLKANPEEIDLFLDDLSINVTHFFRDPEVFAAFQKGALTELVERKSKSSLSLIRIWSAGCASGQEAYSLAIMMSEALGNGKNLTVKIWATDVDKEALKRGEAGEYEQKDLKEVNKKILEKYFVQVYNGKYSVKPEIKQMVKFQKQNLISDPALKFMDIIFCRNVMIYFTRKHQEELLAKFHQALNSGGYLVTSKVEGTWDKEIFTSYSPYNKIYQKAG